MRLRKTKSVTRFLLVTTQAAALGWVTISYVLAAYATIRLGDTRLVTELSREVVDCILGVSVVKGISNIFEHNDGALFGKSDHRRDA